jgi:hypothetical protein
MQPLHKSFARLWLPSEWIEHCEPSRRDYYNCETGRFFGYDSPLLHSAAGFQGVVWDGLILVAVGAAVPRGTQEHPKLFSHRRSDFGENLGLSLRRICREVKARKRLETLF